MRTWLELDGRKVPVELSVAAVGGAVTARASADVIVHGPNQPAALEALGRQLRAVNRRTVADIVIAGRDFPLDAAGVKAAVAALQELDETSVADDDEFRALAAVRAYFATVARSSAGQDPVRAVRKVKANA